MTALEIDNLEDFFQFLYVEEVVAQPASIRALFTCCTVVPEQPQVCLHGGHDDDLGHRKGRPGRTSARTHALLTRDKWLFSIADVGAY